MAQTRVTRKDFLKLTGITAGMGALSLLFGRGGEAGMAGGEMADYIDGGVGFPVFRGPYLQSDVQLAAFQFPVNVAALTGYCNATLNAVPGGRFEYVPLLSSMVVVYADMLVSSLDERDGQVGRIPETELGFWVLTVALQKTRLGKIPHHLAWFIPYLFVDDSSAIATGREVYGFNKQAAVFAKAEAIHAPRFSAEVMGLARFAADAVAKRERLVELAPLGAEAPAAGQWPDWQLAKKDLWRQLIGQIRPEMGQEMVEFAARTALNNIPLVFIKQARHAGQTQKAAYQRIVEAPMHIQTFKTGGFFNQGHEMTLFALDSHPLARKLGLSGSQRSDAGAWARMDFVLEAGVEE